MRKGVVFPPAALRPSFAAEPRLGQALPALPTLFVFLLEVEILVKKDPVDVGNRICRTLDSEVFSGALKGTLPLVDHGGASDCSLPDMWLKSELEM